MSKFISALVAGVVSLAVALLVVQSSGQPQPLNPGGVVENFPSHFSNGLYAGPTDQFSVDSTGETRGKIIKTGDVTTISSGSIHYTAAQLCDASLIKHVVTGVGLTASNSVDVFPTAASLIADCLPTAGDTKRFMLLSYGNDAAEKITPTANTGLDFFLASGSASTINRKDAFLIEMTNIDGASISVSFEKVEDTN